MYCLSDEESAYFNLHRYCLVAMMNLKRTRKIFLSKTTIKLVQAFCQYKIHHFVDLGGKVKGGWCYNALHPRLPIKPFEGKTLLFEMAFLVRLTIYWRLWLVGVLTMGFFMLL